MGSIFGVSTKPEPLEDEYIGEDGLIYCKNCKTLRGEPMSDHPNLPELKGRWQRFMCKCRKEQWDKANAKTEDEKYLIRLKECFSSGAYQSMVSKNFDNDDGKSGQVREKVLSYTRFFRENLNGGRGLLLFGPPGTGKSFYAACIANELLKKGYSVRMANFEELSNELFERTDKNSFINELVNYPLLIIDDLGIERRSAYMQGNVFEVIDSRYRAKKPMIITTNMPINDLMKSDSVENKRIYERIIEVCFPVQLKGRNRRAAIARENNDRMTEQMKMKGETDE